MGRIFGDLYTFLIIFLPWKVVLGLGVALALVALPFWYENVREKQLRGSVRRLVRAEQDERVRLLGETFELAGTRASRLVRLVDAGRHYDQRDVVERALTVLAEVDPPNARRLRAMGAPPKRTGRDPLETVVRVEALLSEGLDERARELLAESLADHPADPELLALRGRLLPPTET